MKPGENYGAGGGPARGERRGETSVYHKLMYKFKIFIKFGGKIGRSGLSSLFHSDADMPLCRQVEKKTASCTACAKEPEARGRYLRIGAVRSALGERPQRQIWC